MTHLLRAWAALMTLTVVLAFAADVSHASRLGLVSIAMIALAVVVKARLVLGVYLGLRVAPGALAGFTSAVVIVLAIVVGSFVIFPTPAPPVARQATPSIGPSQTIAKTAFPSPRTTIPDSAGATE